MCMHSTLFSMKQDAIQRRMEVSSVGSISLNLSLFIPKYFWRENCPSFPPPNWHIDCFSAMKTLIKGNKKKSEALMYSWLSLWNFSAPLSVHTWLQSCPCQSCTSRNRTPSWDHQTWFQMIRRTCWPSLWGVFLSNRQNVKSLGCSLAFESGSQQKCNIFLQN